MNEIISKDSIRKIVNGIYRDTDLANIENVRNEEPELFEEALVESYRDVVKESLNKSSKDITSIVQLMFGAALAPLFIGYKDDVDILVEGLYKTLNGIKITEKEDKE